MEKGLESLSKMIENIDTLRVLFMLEKSKLGRKSISKKLFLGEGYVRKILSKLEQKHIIKKSKTGTELTKKGMLLMNKIKKAIYPLDNITIQEYENMYGVVVKKASNKVYKGLEERDEAVRFGAKGAMIITYEGNKLWFPSIECITDKYPDMDKSIRESTIGLENGDVIIATWAERKLDAERGAFAAGLLLTFKAGVKIKI